MIPENHTGITILGLGDEPAGGLTEPANSVLDTASTVYIKATIRPDWQHLSAAIYVIEPVINPFDGLSDGYDTLIQQLLDAAPVVYAVHGDPIIDEASTSLIQQAAAQVNLPVTLVPNTPQLPERLRRLEATPTAGLQILDATLLCRYHYPPLEPHHPVFITGLYHPALTAPVQRTLKTVYDSQTQLTGITSSGMVSILLADLSPEIDSFLIPAQTQAAGLTRFQEIIAHLRAPDGCPWDRKQNHHTLRPYLLEEAYEVLAAIEANDLDEFADELGDLLLQIVLHAQIAGEADTFRMTDIIQKISQKMLRRHPHVFADIQVRDANEVLVNWAAIKAQEKAEKGEQKALLSAMDDVQLAAPALMQALDISKKAVRMGFEWDTSEDVLRVLLGEAQELVDATTLAEVEAEIGDFLFTAVNLARKLGVDAESALRACNLRFMRRFRRLEDLARERDLTLTELDRPVWRELWQQAKQDVAHLEKTGPKS